MAGTDVSIFVAGHRGMVGSAILRRLQARGYTNIVTATHTEMELTSQAAVQAFFGPDMDAQLMFEPDEWKAAYILNKQKLPDKPPTLNEVTRLVARLGGFLARTGDGEPGVKTIWLGMQRILDFAVGIRFSRELQAQGTCV